MRKLFLPIFVSNLSFSTSFTLVTFFSYNLIFLPLTYLILLPYFSFLTPFLSTIYIASLLRPFLSLLLSLCLPLPNFHLPFILLLSHSLPYDPHVSLSLYLIRLPGYSPSLQNLLLHTHFLLSLSQNKKNEISCAKLYSVSQHLKKVPQIKLISLYFYVILVFPTLKNIPEFHVLF